jgi:hypothetical protein
MRTRILSFIGIFAIFWLLMFWFLQTPETSLTKNTMSETNARAIAEATCIKGGGALSAGIHNEGTKTWWFDANLNATKPGCNPACVVSEETKTAEINWRCTGAIVPPASITTFEECANAGNPIMESYPRQCRADGKTFVEKVETPVPVSQEISCPPKNRTNENGTCITLYKPVCAKVQVQCVRAPCPPINQTFGNSCEACNNPLVSTYTEGECVKQ